MKEITGNIWDYYGKEGFVICITTNMQVRKDGRAVMGKGIALQARERIPGIDKELGYILNHIKPSFGHDGVYWLDNMKVMSFPTKHHWVDKSDIKLIKNSADWLNRNSRGDRTFVITRPGCGNGGLKWEEVKPIMEELPDNVWVINNETLNN